MQPPQAGELRDYGALPPAWLAAVNDESASMRELRFWRRRTLVPISWAQILGLCYTREILTQLSQLADTLIMASGLAVGQVCCREWSTPAARTARHGLC